jgi:hypothetical protein
MEWPIPRDGLADLQGCPLCAAFPKRNAKRDALNTTTFFRYLVEQTDRFIDMLNEEQISTTWEEMLNAETRALYFVDLASRLNRQKQFITFVSFFFSSAAAATIAAKAPDLAPLTMAAIVAILTAYSIAVGLDRKLATMVKLHCAWNRVASDYKRLWNHVHDDEAERVFEEIDQRTSDLSEMAVTDAPNNQKLLDKWQQQVFRQYHLTNA